MVLFFPTFSFVSIFHRTSLMNMLLFFFEEVEVEKNLEKKNKKAIL